MELEGVSKGIERWRFTHQIFNKDNVLAAEIKVYGAWIDLIKRKLTTPPAKFVQIFQYNQEAFHITLSLPVHQAYGLA